MVDTSRQYSDVATVYGAIAIAVFVTVLVAVVFVVARYRRREGDPREPSRKHDAPVGESLYVVGLALIAAFLVAFTFVHENKTDEALKAHPGDPTVRVVAAKWHWSFYYPKGVADLGTDASEPTLHVPANTNVDFALTSADVIHAFSIPMADFKRAAYPQVTQRFTLAFRKPGYFRNAGACAEFCGLLHAEMRFNVDVMPPERYRAWLAGGGR